MTWYMMILKTIYILWSSNHNSMLYDGLIILDTKIHVSLNMGIKSHKTRGYTQNVARETGTFMLKT